MILGIALPAAAATLAAGGIAAVLRYLLGTALAGRGSLPWAVFVVNVIGSAIGGTAVGLAQGGAISADARLVLLAGVAGGLTTFSTWSVDSIQLVFDGHWRAAVGNVGLNLTVGVAVAAVFYTGALVVSGG